jgi:hypothetical protein
MRQTKPLVIVSIQFDDTPPGIKYGHNIANVLAGCNFAACVNATNGFSSTPRVNEHKKRWVRRGYLSLVSLTPHQHLHLLFAS